MKKLLITLLLISPFSFADWGDTYFCSMTSFIGVTAEGNQDKYQLENFKINLDKERRAMVTRSSNYLLDNYVIPVTREEKVGLPLVAQDNYATNASLLQGKLFLTQLHSDIAMVITADCDKF
tara:strand:+ start:373 stop:738 length:366 start_codon:yes stop_codon:yes gene_type:complete